jgi:hypothetical protein
MAIADSTEMSFVVRLVPDHFRNCDMIAQKVNLDIAPVR